MRHGFANKKLNRTSEHRKALLKNMLNSLIKYEQIKTTLPKAKFLKPQADKIITLGKRDTLHNTKALVSQLQDIKSANKVKKTLSKRYEKRSGGYTRIIKAGFRYGDNAPMAIIEFVDRDVEAKKVDRKKKSISKESEKKDDKIFIVIYYQIFICFNYLIRSIITYFFLYNSLFKFKIIKIDFVVRFYLIRTFYFFFINFNFAWS